MRVATVALIVLATMLAIPAADASRHCVNVHTRYISARGIVTFGRLGYAPARAVELADRA
jgi:hypothetical protein